jgi:hypothetical protein
MYTRGKLIHSLRAYRRKMINRSLKISLDDLKDVKLNSNTRDAELKKDLMKKRKTYVKK